MAKACLSMLVLLACGCEGNNPPFRGLWNIAVGRVLVTGCPDDSLVVDEDDEPDQAQRWFSGVVEIRSGEDGLVMQDPTGCVARWNPIPGDCDSVPCQQLPENVANPLEPASCTGDAGDLRFELGIESGFGRVLARDPETCGCFDTLSSSLDRTPEAWLNVEYGGPAPTLHLSDRSVVCGWLSVSFEANAVVSP